MLFEFSEEQQMVRDSARNFLSSKCGVDEKLEAERSGTGYSAETWREMVDLGWLAFAGARDQEEAAYLAILCEELGRASFASPFLSCVGAASTLASMNLGSNLVDAITSNGCLTGIVAPTEGAKITFRRGVIENGTILVEWGAALDRLLVPVDCGGKTTIAIVDLRAEGISISPADTYDNARAAFVSFENVIIGGDDLLDVDSGVFEAAFARSQLFLAAEAVGGAFGALELTVDYVRERHQFGHPIGAFQAVRHGLADVRALIEGAWLALWSGLTAEPSDPSLPGRSAVAVWAAKRAFQEAALKGSQYHGGMGHVVDGHMQFFYRRAGTFHARVANDWTLLGSVATHFVEPFYKESAIGVAAG